jgi:co-chaperonin GroES (HSP10)
MEFMPTADRVLIERIVEEKKSKIIILQEEKTPNSLGKVIAVGPDVKGMGVGDTVMVSNFRGEPVNLGEQKCILYREEEIMGVVKL